MKCVKCSGCMIRFTLYEISDWRCYNCGKRIAIEEDKLSYDLEQLLRPERKEQKSFALTRRNSISNQKKITSCLYCNKPFESINKKHKPRKFCLGRCKPRYYREKYIKKNNGN